MEEDIKILEEKLKIIESLCTDNCINKSTVIEPLKYAIENLINRNKELEKQVDLEYVEENYIEKSKVILKSKVEEYIQELEIEQDKSDDEDFIATEMDIRKNQIYVLQRVLQVLQELIEDK